MLLWLFSLVRLFCVWKKVRVEYEQGLDELFFLIMTYLEDIPSGFALGRWQTFSQRK